jgi:hypothetical protein
MTSSGVHVLAGTIITIAQSCTVRSVTTYGKKERTPTLMLSQLQILLILEYREV